MPMKQVTSTAPPSNIIGRDDMAVDKIYGIKHKKFSAVSKPKKYKVHQRADTGEIEAVGFLNTTGHLREAEKFADLTAVFNYCESKGHKLYQFDTPKEFGEWLNE